MKNLRQTHLNIHRDSWVEINLDYAAHNVKEIKKNIPKNTKLLAVVKADAYGHGSLMLAPTLIASGVDMLGVASIDEGAELREAKVNCEILVLGAVPVWAVESAVKADLAISIFSEEHIDACKRAFERTGVKPKVHIKIDTGMNRIGVSSESAVEFIKTVQSSDSIELQGIFTHLACAENELKSTRQIDEWQKIISQINTENLLLHVQNTAGTLCYNIPEINMVRVGIALYGLLPELPHNKAINIKQILSLKGRIVHIHTVKADEGVSYSHKYIAQNDRLIATVPIGYADGIQRGLSGKIFGVINGKKVPQIGNITMDQMMFDITDVKTNVGDIITLLDENNSIDDWAEILGTINYCLTCSLKVRLPRIYTR